MPIIRAQDAKRFEMHGAEFTGFAAPSRGSNENAVWRVKIAAGTPGTAHRLTKEEIIVALHGGAEVRIDEQTHNIAAGDVVIVPQGAEFSISALQGDPFEAIAILPVGGMAVIGAQAPFTPPWAL